MLAGDRSCLSSSRMNMVTYECGSDDFVCVALRPEKEDCLGDRANPPRI